MNRKYTLDVKNKFGIEMTIALRLQGDKWGLDDCLVWEEEEPIVEVYKKDSDYIISSYYLTTFTRVEKGILLEGSDSGLMLGEENMVDFMKWLEDIDLPDFQPTYPSY